MPDYTITLTTQQDAVFQKALADINLKRSQENPPDPPVTAEQVIFQWAKGGFEAYVDNMEIKRYNQLLLAWTTLTDIQRDQIMGIAGL